MKKFPTPTNVIAFREFLGWIVIIGVHCPILPSRLDHSSCWQEVMFHFCGQNPVWKLQKLEGATHVTRSAGIPDFSESFVLHTDASGKGLGAAVMKK